MKKTVRFFLFIMFNLCCYQFGMAQVKKHACIEQFTQASCGPCAAENPAFNSNILQGSYKPSIHHIAYHVYWPGVDPMYNANPGDVNERVNYYGVSGVPELFMQGITWTGSPSSISNSTIGNELLNSSPIAVSVKESTIGNTRNVTVKVFLYGPVPQGDYVLRTAVVENPVNYSSPPGSNGEKFFPNVFRKMLPNASGESIHFGNIGDSLEFNYTYNLQTNWIASKVLCIAFVEEENSKIILNSGSTNDSPVSFVKPKALFTVINNKGCPGKSIQFYDASINFPNSRTWYFPGGIPSVSNLKNPIVRYDTAGIFDVSLRVNGFGGTQDSLKSSGFISIGVPGITSSLAESFEPASFPPSGWSILNPDKSKTWARTQLAKKSGSSCIFINNYIYNAIGQKDELISTSFNLSTTSNPSLYFQLAYTNLSDLEPTDTLEVLISDCGENYISLYKKWGDDLRTTAPSGYAFYPSDNEWKKQVIDLSAYSGSENAKFIFRQISAAQNNLFIDDIQILDPTGIESIQQNNHSFEIFPNPCGGILNITNKNKDLESIQIYDISGKIVFQSKETEDNNTSSVLNLHSLENGVYTVEIKSKNTFEIKKLVLLK